MGKNLVVAIFVATCVLASLYVATREASRRGASEADEANVPRVSLEEFSIYKYDGHKVKATLTGKIAHFLDPNILELYGNIRGLKHHPEKPEFASSETATIFFQSSGISQLMENTEVREAELEDNVNVGIHFHRLATEYAKYLPKDALLTSEVSVVLKGPSGRLKGHQGFEYHLDEENIRLFGPIEGVLTGAELP